MRKASAKTKLGRRLLALRKKAITMGMKLMSDQEVSEEIAKRRKCK